MKFADIIGHDDIKRHLIATVEEDRISHAQMFLGREGYGTLPLALAYAQYINCSNRTATDSCGECPSCRKISQLAFPDLHFVFPVIPTKSPTKPISDSFFKQWTDFVKKNPYGSFNQWLDFIDAGNSQAIIRADESSEIIRKLTMKSFSAEYKIMVIWMPEKMNQDASNRLLKMIEEPYPKTLFLLVAESSENILPTIISRTQLVKVPRIADADLKQGIMHNLGASDNQASDLVRISEGNFNQAEEYFRSTELSQELDWFMRIMRTCYSCRIQDIIVLADELSALGREKLKALFGYCNRMIRENLVLNRNMEQITHFTQAESDFAQRFSQFIHPQNSALIAREIDLATYHISRNAYAKIVLLDTLIKVARLLRKPYIKP